MKDGRRIIIKNDILRKFRNNLRALLYKLFIEKHTRYIEESTRIIKKITNKEGPREREVIDAEIKKFDTLADELRHAIDKSIIACPKCHKTDRDMAYFADWKKWYCVECFDKRYKAWKKENKRAQDPDYPFQ